MFMFNNNNNNKETTMHKCQICNGKPNEIFIGFLAKQGLKICKPCMSKHGDSHVIIDGEDNFIPTDYFQLKENTMPKQKLNRLFKKIQKFDIIENDTVKHLFKITHLDDSTAIYNNEGNRVMSESIYKANNNKEKK